jgi:hypothetical protein
MTLVYTAFKILMVGTHKLTKKVRRDEGDYPFHKLPNGALNKVPRGWLRTAQKHVLGRSGKALFWAQATVWKDRKQVAFLHNVHLGARESETCKRWRKGQVGKETLKCHPVSIAHSTFMGGVDREDKDSAKWGMSIKTNRWCVRVLFWMIDRVVLGIYIIIQHEYKCVTFPSILVLRLTASFSLLQSQGDKEGKKGMLGCATHDETQRPSELPAGPWHGPCQESKRKGRRSTPSHGTGGA